MKYREDLQGWQLENGQVLNMPPYAREIDVLDEAARLERIANTPPEVVVQPTPEERLDAAIVEYVAITGKPQVVADKAVAQMTPAVAVAYLDNKAVEAKPEPKPDEKPAVHIRRDQKLSLCEYFLGPYTWAFADEKMAQQEIEARGVVVICPKCLDIAGVK